MRNTVIMLESLLKDLKWADEIRTQNIVLERELECCRSILHKCRSERENAYAEYLIDAVRILKGVLDDEHCLNRIEDFIDSIESLGISNQ